MEYKVRFVNPQKHYQDHREEYLAAIDDVLSRGDLMMRQDIVDFEKAIAQIVGTNLEAINRKGRKEAGMALHL